MFFLFVVTQKTCQLSRQSVGTRNSESLVVPWFNPQSTQIFTSIMFTQQQICSWSFQTKKNKAGKKSNGKLPHYAVFLKNRDSTSWLPYDQKRLWATLLFLVTQTSSRVSKYKYFIFNSFIIKNIQIPFTWYTICWGFH